jgi:predicted anti-sigma-YlaC factor YlaD
MRIESFHEWVHQIYTTQDEELDCDGCLESIPQLVDMEIARENVNPRFSRVEHHLSQCPHCYDFYLTLCDAALLESRLVHLESMALHPDGSTQVADSSLSIGGVPLVP